MKTLRLLAIVLAAWWAWNWYQGPTIEVPAAGGVEIRINADSILRIAELAGASQDVQVFFDTTWVEKTQNFRVFGYRIDALERDVVVRYSEARTWRIKAGTDALQLDTSGDSATVVLAPVRVLSIEELPEEFKVLAQTGDNWNPAQVHVHMGRSRALAIDKAVRAGILSRAQAHVHATLSDFLPHQILIQWEQE